MSPIRIKHRQDRAKPARRTYSVNPVTLPTYSFYRHLPVVCVDGEPVIGCRVIPLDPRR
ncbi:MAG: hypothetical protein J0I42_10035 [Bosea sp.]|uniref:hypothetical protein n=1 Tax=Bosea sp. (in: a-proteobacteria) TaxID=1871050 RepID=UPI001AC62297|nr:hypothetical protein [Bosea sp. (in: a-proteobacteria)]MBN9452273.1 hypothetical protein [Bosea sp. (in: a-proteobacteria)]